MKFIHQKRNIENRELILQRDTGKALLKTVMPLLMAMILMLAYNPVDGSRVGNLPGESGSAALTTAGSVRLLPYAPAAGTGNGTSVVVSQFVGGGDRVLMSIYRLVARVSLAAALIRGPLGADGMWAAI
ncbi:MAG: MATE family efflux transporter [Agathobacter sp.]